MITINSDKLIAMQQGMARATGASSAFVADGVLRIELQTAAPSEFEGKWWPALNATLTTANGEVLSGQLSANNFTRKSASAVDTTDWNALSFRFGDHKDAIKKTTTKVFVVDLDREVEVDTYEVVKPIVQNVVYDDFYTVIGGSSSGCQLGTKTGIHAKFAAEPEKEEKKAS